jgi:multidrug resistance efflux pump
MTTRFFRKPGEAQPSRGARAMGKRDAPKIEWERRQHRAPTVLLVTLIAGLIGAGLWAARAPVQIYALANGTLEPRGEIVAVDSNISGRVTKVLVKPWGRVVKGQVLFELDARGTDATDGLLQQKILNTQLEESVRDMDLARSDWSEQSKQVGLLSSLYEVGATARLDLETAQAKQKRAAMTLDRARIHILALELQRDQLARRSQQLIRAPLTGLLTRLAVHGTAQMVQANSRLAEILPEGVPLEFRAALAESERPKVRAGARAEISWNGFPRSQYGVTSGKVIAISPSSSSTGSGGSANAAPSFELRIALDTLEIAHSNGRRAVPGLAGEVRVIANRKTALELAWDWLRGLNPWN